MSYVGLHVAVNCLQKCAYQPIWSLFSLASFNCASGTQFENLCVEHTINPIIFNVNRKPQCTSIKNNGWGGFTFMFMFNNGHNYDGISVRWKNVRKFNSNLSKRFGHKKKKKKNSLEIEYDTRALQHMRLHACWSVAYICKMKTDIKFQHIVHDFECNIKRTNQFFFLLFDLNNSYWNVQPGYWSKC